MLNLFVECICILPAGWPGELIGSKGVGSWVYIVYAAYMIYRDRFAFLVLFVHVAISHLVARHDGFDVTWCCGYGYIWDEESCSVNAGWCWFERG